MNFYVALVLNSFIIVPAIIGWVRYKNISPAYLPFLILIWVGAINEIISFIVIRAFHSNIVNYNLYLLFESLLILWQFHRWRLFEKKKNYRILMALFIAGWLAECLFLTKLYLNFNQYFQIFYSFVIVLMSVNMINHVLMKDRRNLLKNPSFVISVVFVILFTYSVLVEAFWLYGLKMSPEFNNSLHYIFVFVNFLCNVIYALTISWMPKRQAFSLQF
jgi:hypothetical protein